MDNLDKTIDLYNFLSSQSVKFDKHMDYSRLTLNCVLIYNKFRNIYCLKLDNDNINVKLKNVLNVMINEYATHLAYISSNNVFYIYNKRTVDNNVIDDMKSNNYIEYVDYAQYYNKCDKNISCVSFYYTFGNKKTLLFSNLYKNDEWKIIKNNMNTILLFNKMKLYILEMNDYNYRKELAELDGSIFTDKMPIKPQSVSHIQMVL